jgi:Ca2+-binding RTX toxin-like protein
MRRTVLIFVAAAVMVVLSTGAALAATFVGTEGRDMIEGTGRTDRISGSGGDDRLNGLGGKDVVRGGDGADEAGGGYGADEAYGNAGNDVLIDHPDKDTDLLYGGPGNDDLQTRDFPAVRDVLYCGSGRDTAYVDRLDEVRGCEIVR